MLTIAIVLREYNNRWRSCGSSSNGLFTTERIEKSQKLAWFARFSYKASKRPKESNEARDNQVRRIVRDTLTVGRSGDYRMSNKYMYARRIWFGSKAEAQRLSISIWSRDGLCLESGLNGIFRLNSLGRQHSPTRPVYSTSQMASGFMQWAKSPAARDYFFSVYQATSLVESVADFV